MRDGRPLARRSRSARLACAPSRAGPANGDIRARDPSRYGRWFVALCVVALVAESGAVSTVSAQTIHKCRDADGHLAYQDTPCGAAESLPAPVIAPAPDYVPPPASPGVAPAPNIPPPESDEVAMPVPRPTQFECTTFDGKAYVSSNGNPPPRQVPLVALNFPQPYEPGDITRGGSRQALTTPRADAYTTVQDRCRPLRAREQCALWKRDYDETAKQRRLAFNDTRAALEQQEATLRGNLATWCGR
jgi:hypothetical protein